jgi:hypothetical protein
MVNYKKSSLKKLEALIAENGYEIIYDKGQFKSGYCIVNNSNTIVINKYFDTQGKISALQDIIDELDLQQGIFNKKED